MRIRKCWLLILFVPAIIGIIVLLAQRDAKNGMAQCDSSAEVDSDLESRHSPEVDVTLPNKLGLLSSVGAWVDGQVTVEMLQRYKELYNRIFPDRPFIEPAQEGQHLLSLSNGILDVCFDKYCVRVVADEERWDEITSSGGNRSGKQELPLDKREMYLMRFKTMFKTLLDLEFDDTFQHQELWHLDYNGREICGGNFVRKYHGYLHRDEFVNISVELCGDDFVFLRATAVTSNVYPPEPVISISLDEAADIALRAVTDYYDSVRKTDVECDFVGTRIIASRVSYVYRNDLLKDFANWYKVADKRLTHLCYVVRVLGAAASLPSKWEYTSQVVTVYVDTADGSVVGGELDWPQ